MGGRGQVPPLSVLMLLAFAARERGGVTGNVCVGGGLDKLEEEAGKLEGQRTGGAFPHPQERSQREDWALEAESSGCDDSQRVPA